MSKELDNITFILSYADGYFSEIGITFSDLMAIKNRMWIELMGEYIWTRGYSHEYYYYIFMAIKQGLIDKMDPMKVLSGALQEEYEMARLIR